MSCVIVLGCYRSGTSAVAGILHHLGVMMGKEFDEPAHSNPKGYYEDIEFKRLYDMLIKGQDVSKLLDVLIRIREAEYPIWGVKDPQLCLLLNKFTPLIKTEHRIISTLRSKEEICKSLCKAIDSTKDFTPLVERYLNQKKIELDHYKGPVLEVDFEQLKINKQSEVERIAQFVGLPVKQEAIDFIA